MKPPVCCALLSSQLKTVNGRSTPSGCLLKHHNKYILTLLGFLIISILLLNACTSTTRFSKPRYQAEKIPGIQADSDLYSAAQGWLHTPYRYGGTNRKGIDCSALTRNIYRKVYGIELPRTVDGQIDLGQFVRLSGLNPGDLLFFRNSRGGPVDHVGIYLGDQQFVHASVQRGVIISEISDQYYQSNFVTARRIVD